MNSISNIQAKIWPIVVILIGLGLSACYGPQVQPGFNSDDSQASLDFWLEDSLIPYLIQQFDQHPRFKGQPILLVRMQGENVVPRIDEMTEQIRQHIADAMLKNSGIDLAWRPSMQPWQHHQSLEDISCGDYSKVRYYVGIDIQLSRDERKLEVKVRALNLAEEKWVSGFGKSWQGIPTKDQLEALAREHPDEYLRGLRPLPFSNRQADMLAAYLSRNLSCLLRQGEADDLVVHVANPDARSPQMFKTTLELVARYLTRFREVAVTDDPNQANVTVVSAIHSIDQKLHQVWISARQHDGEKYLPGAETEAYVLLNTRNETVAAGMNPPKPAVAVQPLQKVIRPSEIISSFELITPLNQRFCATERPWRSGVQRVAPHESLLSGSCLAVEMDINTPAYVFLMGQDALGELSRMFPSNCPTQERKPALLQPGEFFQFPSLSDPQTGVLELAGSPGTERIYAIAITTPNLAAMFADRMQDIQGLCRPGSKFPDMLLANSRQHPQARIHRWQNYLKQLAIKNPGQLEWREFSFRHARLQITEDR